jgi:hypothetical protein
VAGCSQTVEAISPDEFNDKQKWKKNFDAVLGGLPTFQSTLRREYRLYLIIF